MNNIALQMRAYAPSDLPLLTGWWLAHDGQRRPEGMLPKCGVVCEMDGRPVAALFLHMDNSCGMCMAEHAVSAPGLSLKQAREAFRHCVACLKQVARVHGYHTMAAYVSAPVARILKSQGFATAETDLVQMLTSTEDQDHG
jgi:hypothetical protein